MRYLGIASCFAATFVLLSPSIAVSKTGHKASQAATSQRTSTPAFTDEQASAYFDSIIATDAQSWVVNRYDRGSMHNMKVVSISSDRRVFVLYGEYTYNGGRPGWVKAQFSKPANDNMQLDCLEFWDFSGICRALGQSPSRGIMAAAVQAFMSSDGGGSGGGHCDSSTGNGCSQKEINDINEDRFINWRNQQNNGY